MGNCFTLLQASSCVSSARNGGLPKGAGAWGETNGSSRRCGLNGSSMRWSSGRPAPRCRRRRGKRSRIGWNECRRSSPTRGGERRAWLGASRPRWRSRSNQLLRSCQVVVSSHARTQQCRGRHNINLAAPPAPFCTPAPLLLHRRNLALWRLPRPTPLLVPRQGEGHVLEHPRVPSCCQERPFLLATPSCCQERPFLPTTPA